MDRARPWRPALVPLAGALAIASLTYVYGDLLGDSFWYVAVGRIIRAQHALPTRDALSFTSTTVPWTVHMPLSPIVFAAITDALGLRALLLFGVLVFAAAITLAWLGSARTVEARIATLPFALFAVWLQRDDFCTRGQDFADLFFAALLLLIFALRDGRAISTIALGLAGLALGCAWTNLHSSALIAPAMPLLVGAPLVAMPRSARAALAPFGVLAASLAAGLLLNPYGARLLTDVLVFAASPGTASIDLFRSPEFRDPAILALFAGVLALSVAVIRRASADLGWSEAVLLVAWLGASCLARRHVELLSIAALVVAGRLASRDVAWSARFLRVGAPALFAAAAILLVLAARTRKDPLAQVPADAAAYVVDHHLPANVLDVYHWGGYLDYAWAGSPRVFVDGRKNLFDNGVYDDLTTIASLAPGWGSLLDVYEIDTILWENGAPLDLALRADPEWREAFRGRLAVVYVRRAAESPSK